MEGFCKTKACPSSEELLAFQAGVIDIVRSSRVRRHLILCEFCEAELAFYKRYPPGEIKIEQTTIPEPMLELAEELLQKERNLEPLYRLVRRG
ncbi:MAG: hypothetical protein DMF63_05665 [Acidobacteria bacterium]|nr:MAG: hypothetical protein DMF63_05665 [Acidobacteriota bacterium]